MARRKAQVTQDPTADPKELADAYADLRALAHVTAFKNALQEAKDAEVRRLREWRDTWRGIWRESQHGYVSVSGSHLFIKEPLKGMDALTAKIVAALFAGKTPFKMKPREREDDTTAGLNERYELWQFEMTDVRDVVEGLVETALWAGYCIPKVTYKLKQYKQKGIGTVEEVVKDAAGNPVLDDTGKPTTRTDRKVIDRTITEYEGPALQKTDLFEIWRDPRLEDLQSGPGIAEEYKTSYTSLKKLQDQKTYRNVEKLKLSSGVKQLDADMRFTETTGIPAPADTINGVTEHKITEFWGLWDPKGDGDMVECQIVIGDDSIVLVRRENPNWHGRRPYKLVRTRDTGDGIGLGISETVGPDSHYLNDITNQRIDNVTLILNAMPVIKRNNVDPRQAYVAAGNVIEVRDDVNKDIRWDRPPDVTPSAYQEIRESKGNIRETIGATDTILGLAQPNKTATEIKRLELNANDKFKRLVERFERHLIKWAARMYYMINQQVMKQSVTFRLGIGPIETIEPEHIHGDWDVIPQASTQMLAAGDSANRIQLLQLATEMKQAGANININFEELFLQIAEGLGVETDRIILKPEEVVPPGIPTAPTTPEQIPGQGQVTDINEFRGAA